MRAFRDATGRLWRPALDSNAIQTARRQIGVNLSELAGGGNLRTRLARSTELVGAVLWCMCQSQAAARGVGPAEFRAAVAPALGRGIAAAIANAMTATGLPLPSGKRTAGGRANRPDG